MEGHTPGIAWSRQAKTDFIMLGPEQEVYEPGRYSEDPLSSNVWIFRGFDMWLHKNCEKFINPFDVWGVEPFASCIGACTVFGQIAVM